MYLLETYKVFNLVLFPRQPASTCFLLQAYVRIHSLSRACFRIENSFQGNINILVHFLESFADMKMMCLDQLPDLNYLQLQIATASPGDFGLTHPATWAPAAPLWYLPSLHVMNPGGLKLLFRA